MKNVDDMSWELAKVFENTLRYTSPEDTESVQRYDGILLEYTPSQRHPDGVVITIENRDCLEVCADYSDKKTACLNMASAFVPGGGVRKGSRAQEEHICRCTALYHTLKEFDDGHRPYLRDDQIIYSTGVPVVKDHRLLPLKHRYRPLFKTDFISCAAIRFPKLDENGHYSERDAELMDSKVEQILQLADYSERDILVLGAFGCGAYRNPPDEVAEMFAKRLRPGGEYYRSFERVVFAVMERTPYLGPIFKRAFM